MANTPKKKNNANKKNTPAKVDVAGLVKKSLFIVVAMTWTFILGVLVGKGYKPENAVPEIARIMPAQPEISPKKPKMLTAEELGFYDRLKNNHPTHQVQNRKPPRVVHATPKPAPKKPKPFIHKAAVQKKTPPASSSTPAKSVKRQRFTFVYQIAAFRNESDAIKVQQQIIRMGIAAYVTRTTEGWNRVFARIKGTDGEVGTAMKKIRKIGGPKPFLRTKNPV